MTEINKDIQVKPFEYRNEAKNNNKEEIIEKDNKFEENHQINLENSPNALYGRVGIEPKKLDSNDKDMKKCVQESTNEFIDDPENCYLATTIIDVLLEQGLEVPAAINAAEEIIQSLKEEPSSL